jgi:peroxiredoxin Q/BCP
MLKIGDKMPDFEVIDQNGNTVTSQDLLGKKTVIYFYPKDNTSGCTAQACNLRDNYARLVAKGYNVIGISRDSVNSHKDFASKHDLPFTLLSDTSAEILQAFGAWGENKIDGKTTVGPLRKTFIFDEDGILVKIIDKVDTKDHASQILE